jgi:hypothetical protein
MLTVTPADHSFAAELGLMLVPPAKDDESKKWIVKVAADKRVVGQLDFTDFDAVYVRKAVEGISNLEETVADALRWIAPIIRHVWTGEYDGTETIVRRSGAIFERPRAVTECGAKSTPADYGPMAAKTMITDGTASEMCRDCRGKLETRDVRDHSNLSERSMTATPKQRSFIRFLLDEAARNGRPYMLDARQIDQMSAREASATIDVFKSLKARNWKGAL